MGSSICWAHDSCGHRGGNDCDRPQASAFDDLDTDFLQRLAEVGVRPANVDVVINTHIHYDHIGWNTRRQGTSWVPAFPNATYVVPQLDYDYFQPDNAARMPPAKRRMSARFEAMRLVFEDSTYPLATPQENCRVELELPGADAGHPARALA
ncbi:MBL fold metallo-hydrolase [Mycolicibacterium vinylchloridicum]|uniref:MBL fold metallo-hydrolase n=1 Tax=Mycolicibacterium vinylchloridicum TaxID=2736928 RepID=UPI001C538E85|nr:MBL fold metallo-hydrolase [Mycolicibacterium vinylchloridicum]